MATDPPRPPSSSTTTCACASCQRYRNPQGFAVKGASATASRCSRRWTAATDLIVLDLMLPGESGWTSAGCAPNDTTLVVILHRARATRSTASSGWKSAPTTTRKPVNPRELLARIRADPRPQRAPPALARCSPTAAPLQAGRSTSAAAS